ncbi:MAG: cell division protein SepF [Clostridia bacterium]|nr:cell division protein SepF [Clostridia bacterium]
MFERWAEKFRDKKKVEEDEIQFKNFDESVKAAPKTPEPAPTYNVAPATIEGNIELKVVRPATFEEVSTIADYLIDGCTVVLNLELLDRAMTIRMLDFLNGVTYVKDGEIKNVAPNTYIVTPSGIDVND